MESPGKAEPRYQPKRHWEVKDWDQHRLMFLWSTQVNPDWEVNDEDHLGEACKDSAGDEDPIKVC